MNLKKLGFSQRKPKEPGVYFIRTDGHLPLAPARRLQEKWDIAYVYFLAGSYSSYNDNREAWAHWHIQTLDGLAYTWRRGIWLKGPLTPFDTGTLPTSEAAVK